MKVGIICFVVTLIGVFGVITPVKVEAKEKVSWTENTPTITKNTVVSEAADMSCPNYIQQLYVAELQAERSVCMDGDDRLRIGNVGYFGSSQALIALPYSNKAHLLQNVCSSLVCRYSADTDVLVTSQQISHRGWGVVVYQHVSQRIHTSVSSEGTTLYAFDRTNPDFSLKNEIGGYIGTGSFAMSENGGWVTVEIQDKGLAVINTQTLAVKQIATSGYMYGYAMDPTEELAVSNDGKSVAAMGMNAGFRVYDVDELCGQAILDSLSLQPSKVECPYSDFGIGHIFPNFRIAQHPRFYGDGSELEVIVGSYVDGQQRVTFTAAGTMPAHHLQYLALGDSFTSGEGETDNSYYMPEANNVGAACHVSIRAYPALIAKGTGISTAEAKNISCAGAQIGDLVGSAKEYWGQGDRLTKVGVPISEQEKTDRQEQAVSNFVSGEALQTNFIERYNPVVISIGIGGNDAGLMGKLRTCAMPGTCEWAEAEGITKTNAEIGRLFDKLGALFLKVKEQSRTSRVVIVGYPEVIDPEGVCDPMTKLLLDHTERVFMQNSIRYLNQVIRAATDKAGFLYADVERSYMGNMLCSDSTSPAMNGVRFGNDIAPLASIPILKIIGSETFHPTPAGHALVAASITAQYPNFASSELPAEKPGVQKPQPNDGNSVTSDTQSYISDFVVENNIGRRSITISLPADSVQPNSSVTAVLRSDPVVLGTFLANENGGIAVRVQVPISVNDGFHTLHLLAINRDNAAIDMYQFVTIGQMGEDVRPNTPLSGASESNSEAGNVPRAASISVPEVLPPSIGTSLGNIPANSFVMDILGVQTVANGIGESGTKSIESQIYTEPRLPTNNVTHTVEKIGKWMLLGLSMACILCIIVAIFVVGIVRRRWAKRSS